MALRLLHTSASLHLFHDTDHDWLYLDWSGSLTIEAAQAGWLTLTRCLLERPYGCVLNSNAQVTHVDYAVRRWLLSGFERFLDLAGVQQLAWVHAPTGPGFCFAASVAATLSQLSVSLFADEEQAASWLEQHCHSCCTPWAAASASHSPATLRQLRHLEQALARGAATSRCFHRLPDDRSSQVAAARYGEQVPLRPASELACHGDA